MNNDLRIAITPAPVGLVTSIRTYRVENGKDVLVGEKDVQRLSVEELRDYINREKTIDGGIRNFRLAISEDTPAGIVTDVKSVLRQMTTGVGIATILYESYEQPDDQEASRSANLDIRFTDPSTGRQMPLTTNINEFPVLLVYDNSVIEKGNDTKSAIDLGKDSYTQKELATIFGVKPEQVKAFMIRKGTDATSVWGTRGTNGVLQVLSPQKYNQLQQDGKLEEQYLLAK